MVKMMSFPVGNAHIKKAIDADDATIGVSITLLVLPNDFEKLPEMFRESAHDVYAARRTAENMPQASQ